MCSSDLSQLLCFLRNNNAIVKKHTSPEYCSKRAFVSPYSISPNITVEKSGNRNFAFNKSIARPEF